MNLNGIARWKLVVTVSALLALCGFSATAYAAVAWTDLDICAEGGTCSGPLTTGKVADATCTSAAGTCPAGCAATDQVSATGVVTVPGSCGTRKIAVCVSWIESNTGAIPCSSCSVNNWAAGSAHNVNYTCFPGSGLWHYEIRANDVTGMGACSCPGACAWNPSGCTESCTGAGGTFVAKSVSCDITL